MTSDEEYYENWGVNQYGKYFFFFDESGNSRKFWIKEDTSKFNTDYDTDFVLAGIAFKDKRPDDLEFESIRDRIGLQKNVKELKFNKQFKSKDFLDLMNNKSVINVLQIIEELNAYVHFCNVNNLYYTLVELLDSITDPGEIWENGFDYFLMKSVLYDTLHPSAEKLQGIMWLYKYPNLKKDIIPDFCADIINLFPYPYDRSTEQKYLVGCLKRAAEKRSLFFLEDNTDHVMQANYLEFYCDPISTYKNSEFWFDEELVIQELIKDYPIDEVRNAGNYSFIKSEDNVYIQLSDFMAGTFGRLFQYVNKTDVRQMRKDIDGLNERQLNNLHAFAKLVYKSDAENRGFIHSLAPIVSMKRKDEFLLSFV